MRSIGPDRGKNEWDIIETENKTRVLEDDTREERSERMTMVVGATLASQLASTHRHEVLDMMRRPV